MKKPKVSIIIPVYNGSLYLEEAIETAINQTYDNIEVIVVNDGSNDNNKTRLIAEKYKNKIKYFEKENGGVSTALNLGIKKMTGSYFSWLSHDDKYKPDKIEKQIKYLFDNNLLNSNVILYGDFEAIDKKSKYLWTERKDHNISIDKPEYILLRGQINGITLLIPKKAFDDCGLFDEKLRCTQDYELWNKMCSKYKFIHLPYIVAESRFHPNQVTNKSPLVITEGNKLWLKLIKNVPDNRKKELEGSLYAFYMEMLNFIKDSGYDEVISYCRKQVEKMEDNIKYNDDVINYQKRKKNETIRKDNKSITKKIKLSIKTVGVKKTLKKIIDKFNRS